ncbi:M18 family aminopeptidase [Haloglycomyces albus]|uniref:M18 family aminopeptidase n=1 Tax=Haloglycomyces albus TaxID=526067 RepID=UPI00046D5EE4|nr:M18 family aminopeptidase [Haloglycomyces albus]
MAVFDDEHSADLAEFIHRSPSPYHACENSAARLRAAGFRELAETDPWPRDTGGFFVVKDGSIIAWRVETREQLDNGFRIFGAHTDSPMLKVKPQADAGTAGWKQVAVETYGGIPFDTWLDQDLGIAGRLALRDGSIRLVHVDRPVLRVPRLAIHLDREVNKSMSLNPQQHLTPVWGLGGAEQGEFLRFVAEEAQVDPADVLGYDLVLPGTQRPEFLGKDGEFLAAPRLDNLMSTHAGLEALLRVRESTKVPVFVSFNHEESGSMTSSGAQSPFLERTLRRILAADEETVAQRFAASTVMSSDTGQAVHPNYVERHEPGHHPLPNGGPMLKVSANERYATGAEEQALFTRSCERAEIPWQFYVNRNDIPGGTTIGPLSATQLSMLTVDVGPGILSMHSSRELCGTKDVHYLADLALGYFQV